MSQFAIRGNVRADHSSNVVSRRSFFKQSAATGGALLAASGIANAYPSVQPQRRPKVAVLFTEFTYRSHAHVIIENFLGPYPFNGKMTDPGVDLVAFWGDQFPDGEMSREVSRDYGIPMFKTINDALCLGGKELAVDAVLAIGENGTYPRTKEWVVHYPRKRFFDESVAVMKRSGKFIPYFNDKQLCYRWDWAKEMYDTSRELGIPLMSGSSVPLAQRTPPLEIPAGAEIAEAMVIHGGEFENYGIHAYETLQSMVEFRKGGETGISQIEVLYGDELWKGAEAGKWPFELAAAAVELEIGKPYVPGTLPPDHGWTTGVPHGFLVTYKDGLKGYILKLGGYPMRWQFACRLKGESQIQATQFYGGTWNLRNLFKALGHAIQHFYVHREAPYPVERCLLANGAILASVDAYFQRDKPLATPHLEFGYTPRDFTAFREMGETWKTVLREGTPEPKGIAPVLR